MIFFTDQVFETVASNEVIKVKFEVDTNPPAYAAYENKYQLMPIPYQVTLYDLPSLFTGKIHAVICRNWKNRIKGRDLYDYIFYLTKEAPFNLKHLQARLAQTGHIDPSETLTLNKVKGMLKQRFDVIDYKQASQDVLPFIKNPNCLDIWSKEFFTAITEKLEYL